MIAAARWVVGVAIVMASLRVGYAQTLVINEVDYDQPGTDSTEFVEIANVSAGDIDLAGFELAFINGSDEAQYRSVTLPDVVLPAGGLFVVCANIATTLNCDLDSSPDENWIQNGAPDAVALRDPTSAIVDTVSYEGDVPGFTEGTGIPTGAATVDNNLDEFISVSRSPEGADTDDNSVDFALVCSTPGLPNTTDAVDCACGNGIVDDGEQCDDGVGVNGTAASCCDAACAFVAVDTACGDSADDECTAPDTCDGAGTCLANDEADGTACTDDGNDCTGDVCGSGACTHPALDAGTSCGDGTDDDCLNPDICDGAGTCLANDEADGAACSDDGSDCTADVCGSGVCTHPALEAGTSCGDGTDDDCRNPDSCDGAGACLANDEADGTACGDDGNDCTGDVCGSGACTHPALEAGTSCGDGTDDDCLNPDICDGAGTCLSNDAADGTACTDDGMFCTGAETCISGVCEGEGDPCTGATESCNEADDTCDVPPCGDGVVVGDEECDDMNADADDGCTDCTVDDGFVCDDAEPSVCVQSCGNGALDPGEECEDGNIDAGDGCDSSCRVEVGFECIEDTATGLDVCASVCGDGVVLDSEDCDDGNASGGDGCTRCTVDSGYTCQLEPSVCLLVDAREDGCGCQAGRGTGGSAALLLLIGFLYRRRRCC